MSDQDSVKSDPYSLDGPFSFGERKYSRLLGCLKDRSIKGILEFGSGRTTARFCRDFPAAHVVSVDDDATYLDHTRSLCSISSSKERLPVLLLRPIRWQVFEARLFSSYDLLMVPKEISEQVFDFCFIDGPVQNRTLGGREFVLYRIFQYIRPGGLIVLDDAHRSDSERAIANWMRKYAGAVRLLWREADLAILEKTASSETGRFLGAGGWMSHHSRFFKVLFKAGKRKLVK